MFLGGGESLGPVLGGEFVDGVIGISREAGEQVVKVSQGINAPAAAALQDCVEDGGFLSGFGCPDKEPVLFADGRGPDGILDQIVVDLHAPGVEVNLQRGPDGKGVSNGLAHVALGQEAGREDFEGSLQPIQDWPGGCSAGCFSQHGTGFSFSQGGFDTVEGGDVAEDKVGDSRLLLAGLVKLAPGRGHAPGHGDLRSILGEAAVSRIGIGLQ